MSGFASSTPTALQLLIDEIKFQQQKELQFAALQDTGGFLRHGTTFWTDIFVRHFLFQLDRSIDADDLLFFIRKRHVRTTLTMPKFQTDVEVFRKDSKKLPIGDPEIEWKETVFLNLIIHHLEYTLTLAICTRTSPKDLQVLKRHTQKVYASPSRRRMDTKGDLEEITYPHISFMVDNFDEVYSDMSVRDGEMVCVELVGSDRDHGFQVVLFLGSIRYDALKRVYESRASLGSKMAQKMTFGFFGGSSQRVEYVRLRGPHDKGHAEIAVSKPKGSGVETPTSEPGFSMTDGMWDSESESDTEEFVFKHHRRLSDPSSNLQNYTRNTGWKPKGGGCSSGADGKRTRSQSDGLDHCGLAEIEAGDLRDEGREDEVWSLRGCCPPSHRTCSECCSCACCACPPRPFPRSQSLRLDSIPLNQLGNRSHSHHHRHPPSSQHYCELESQFYHQQRRQSSSRVRVRRHPLIPSKTVVDPPWRSNSFTFPDNKKSNSVACLTDARLICREKLLQAVPNKLSSTGVRVLYVCDVPLEAETNKTELDDGAYNPLWTMRGNTQSFHMWRENRRQQSTPLNAFLTYISLPASTIIKDILENHEEPVLTF
ncbi:uncharacterized protein LOC110855886 isoform X1 [Folsomia candida]|uniref:uncharacterized protein LOC110855886 isoform X1 n=1 Tax=Folsomia candida TaxID=158441 RepID=UPI000B8FC37A|nr:uncharacterized protein LOC110855886 isoform X1 [Folsomia candida]